MESESTFVNFLQLSKHRGTREKKYQFVNLANCAGKTEQLIKVFGQFLALMAHLQQLD